jgi:carbonic anhydrase
LGTNEVVVIHHTECGMLTFSNQDLVDKVQKELGVDASEVDFLPFKDLEQSVRDDVEILRSSPLIPQDIPISGAIYDVRTGRLQPSSWVDKLPTRVCGAGYCGEIAA